MRAAFKDQASRTIKADRSAAPRLCMALAGSGGSQTTTGLNCLLRSRLRVAASIALFGSTSFLIKWLVFQPAQSVGHSQSGHALHLMLVAVELLCCVTLWTRLTFS